MEDTTADFWVKKLDLAAHPEGGYYKEVYRSAGSCVPAEIGKLRSYITSIYFLIEKNNKSHFHSIKQDELWFYHAGAPLQVYILTKNKTLEVIKIGPNPDQGEVLQATVPAGSIFGSMSSGSFSLVSCVVAPGFDFDDFKLYKHSELIEQFPEEKKIIDVLAIR